ALADAGLALDQDHRWRVRLRPAQGGQFLPPSGEGWRRDFRPTPRPAPVPVRPSGHTGAVLSPSSARPRRPLAPTALKRWIGNARLTVSSTRINRPSSP